MKASGDGWLEAIKVLNEADGDLVFMIFDAGFGWNGLLETIKIKVEYSNFTVYFITAKSI
jgi:hypothetical protein